MRDGESSGEEGERGSRDRAISRSGTRHFNTKWRHLKLYLYWIEIHGTRLFTPDSRVPSPDTRLSILEHSSHCWEQQRTAENCGHLGLWASAQAQHVAKPIIILVWHCNKRMNKWTRSESGTPKQFSFHRLNGCPVAVSSSPIPLFSSPRPSHCLLHRSQLPNSSPACRALCLHWQRVASYQLPVAVPKLPDLQLLYSTICDEHVKLLLIY